MISEEQKSELLTYDSSHLKWLIDDKELFIKHLTEDKPTDVDWRQWAIELEQVVSLCKSELARRGLLT